MTIEPEVPTEEYQRWLGDWEVADKDGVKLFDITIIQSENNMWYYMGGWESGNIYAFDTYDPMLMPELFFDKESGKLGFVSEYVNTLITESDNIDFYFSGTFVGYGTTYVLGNEMLNYMMADAVFTETVSYSQARIESRNFITNGRSPGAISLAPPTLPLTMTKKQ